jgi:poly(A) polymerase
VTKEQQSTGADAPENPCTDLAEAALRLAVWIAEGQGRPTDEQTQRAVAVSPDVELGPQARELLERILLGQRGEDVEAALQWLHDAGLLAYLLPELEATVDFTQEMGRRHKDVWKHTKQVVAQSKLEPAIRWAALLHDVGKVPTRAFALGGKVTFYGHAELGARMFDGVARRLAFPRPLRKRVRFLILHHLRANQYDGTWTDSAVRRFDREMDDHLEDLLLLSRADITSARPHKVEAAVRQIDELRTRVVALREIDSRLPPLPSGLGNAIMERFDLAPGRIIGELRRELEQAVESGALEARQPAEHYLEHLARHSPLLSGRDEAS